MKLSTLILALFLVSSAWAAPETLLGQTMIRAAAVGLKRTVTNTGVDLAAEVPLQGARGEKPSEERAFGEVLNGNILVDAAAWVAGHAVVEHLLGAATMAAKPFLGALLTNLGGELLANTATTVYKKQPFDAVDFAGRSVFGAVGGAVGQVLLPEFPVIGYMVGATVGDILWERIALARKPAATPAVSKPVEWYAGQAPPLGPYRAPSLRGAPFLL